MGYFWEWPPFQGSGELWPQYPPRLTASVAGDDSLIRHPFRGLCAGIPHFRASSMAFGALPRAAKSWSKAVLRSVSFLSLPSVIPMSPEGAALLTQPRGGVETSAARSDATLGHRRNKRRVLKGRSSNPKANLQADFHLAAPPRSVLSGLRFRLRPIPRVPASRWTLDACTHGLLLGVAALPGLRGTLAPISAALDSVRVRGRQPDSSPISRSVRRDSALSGIESMAFGALPRAAKSWSKAVWRSVSFLSLPSVIPMSPEGAALLTQPRRGVETSAARSDATLGLRRNKRRVLKGRSSNPKANLQADLHLAAPPRSVLSGLRVCFRPIPRVPASRWTLDACTHGLLLGVAALSGLRGTLAPISAALDSVRVRGRQPDSSPISRSVRRDSALSGIKGMAFGALPRAAKSWSKAVWRSVSFLSLPAVIPMSPEGAALLAQPRRGVETSAARSDATLGHRRNKRRVLKGRSSNPKANLQAGLHLAASPRSVLSDLGKSGRVKIFAPDSLLEGMTELSEILSRIRNYIYYNRE